MDFEQRSHKCYFFPAALIISLGSVNGYINHLIAAMPFAYWSLELLYWIVLPVVIFSFLIHFCGLRLSDLGINGCIFGLHSVPLVLIVSVAFAPLSLWWYHKAYLYFSTHFPAEPFFAYQMVIPADPVLKQLIALYFALTAGVVEELYYRGLFFRFARCFKTPAAVYLIASPLLFSLVHWEGGVAAMLAAYAYGLFAALFFLIMRNLWPLIIGHIYTDYMWFST